MPAAITLNAICTLALFIQLCIFLYLYFSNPNRVRFFRYLIWAWGFFVVVKGAELTSRLYPGVVGIMPFMQAATNRDLAELMRQGAFWEDLFYRLHVVPVVLPPLRERREDIPILAEHFLERLSRKHGRALRLTAEAVERLLRYPWPGNVRELENAMERTAILLRSDLIGLQDLPSHIAAGTTLGPAPVLPREQTLVEVEKTHILQTLERCGWNHSQAAELLGIGRPTLWRKLKEYQIEDRLG